MALDTNSSQKSEWVITTDRVFPNDANPLDTMFGGQVLAMMDVNTSIAATRFCRNIVVTASTEPVDFRNPIYVGEIIELKSRVAWVGNSSMIVRCEVHGENSLTGERRLCTIGHFNFVSLTSDGKPTLVPRLLIEDRLEQRHWDVAKKVKEAINYRRSHEACIPS